jgi:excisionase family DNA binding protein
MKTTGLLTASEIAAVLGVHRSTVYRWVAHGCPAVETAGRRLRFDLAAVNAWDLGQLESAA